MGNLLKRFKSVRSSLEKFHPTEKSEKKKLVVITGCDSGLGYSLSLKCSELGFTVFSGCFDTNSEGAKMLVNHCHVHNLDITEPKSVCSLLEQVTELIKNGYKLHALVNNAGVMIFGEFEWYTEHQIEQQVKINMLGSFRTAKMFLPLLRKHKGRLINITSHCALANLPSLSVYGATKAAVQSWSNGLRLEQTKYGVKVISFIPGSFTSQSNIMAAQQTHSEEMEKNFTPDDKQFYEDYFQQFNSYLRLVAGENKPLVQIQDERLYEKFTEALVHENPKPVYKNEPWRYFFYYNALQIAPYWCQDYLVKKFMKFPQFQPKNSINDN